MAIYLNFKDFTVSDVAGANYTACISANQLVDLCTAAQLNRFAEKLIGKRFERGTPKKKGAEIVYKAMEKSLKAGTDSPPSTKKKSGDHRTEPKSKPPTTPPKKSEDHRTKSKPEQEPPPKSKPKRVGYDKAVQAVHTEYANKAQALKTITNYVGNQGTVSVLARMKKERDEHLQALKEVKAYL